MYIFKWDITLWTLTTVFSAIYWYLVQKYVTCPFIDEKFHLKQCQTYCNYNFTEWDNKITTPPGLYILGFVYTKIISLFTSETQAAICENESYLRSLNYFGGLVVLPIVLISFKSSNFSAINIVNLPILVTYYYLYYTDVWATILILIPLALIIRLPFGFYKSNILGAFISWLSLWFRQTNIMWVVFLAAYMIDTQVNQTKTSFNMNYVSNYTKQTISNFLALIPYGFVVLSFAGFVYYNRGITLGDKENHSVNLHLTQIFYCFVFMVIFTWPAWFSKNHIKKYMKFSFGGVVNILCTLLSCCTIKYIIDNYTIIHPFLLADNRHYTFYIWRRLLNVNYSYIVAVPLYHFSTWTIISTLKETQSSLRMRPIVLIAYICVVCTTIIPSPLFEPRYYILPVVIYRIFLQTSEDQLTKRSLWEFLWLQLINLFVMGVFINYTFPWNDEQCLQRIIW